MLLRVIGEDPGRFRNSIKTPRFGRNHVPPSDTIDFPNMHLIGTHPKPSDVDYDPCAWSPLPNLGGAGFYTQLRKTRITGLRLAPPGRDVAVYNIEKREQADGENQAKHPAPSRRAITENTYRSERTRSLAPSESREEARELRRQERLPKERERDLMGRQLMRRLRNP